MKPDIQPAVERLLLENYETYYRLAYSYVRNEQDALDIVQESAYRAIKKCRRVKQPEFLSTWVCRIVINTALDLVRQRKREEPSPHMPDAVWEDRQRDLDLEGLLMALDEKSRAVLILRYFEDKRLEEIAAVTGDSLSAVKARLYRALKKLRQSL